MIGPADRLVVLGVGNALLGDDGVGVHVVRELDRLARHGDVALPDGTTVLDGGTLGPDLLAWVGGARALLLVDAANLEAPPGTMEILRDADLVSNGGPASPRRAGVGELLDVARLGGMLPREVALVAIQPGSIDVGLELSAPVAAALPAALEAVAAELGRMAARGRSPGTEAAA